MPVQPRIGGSFAPPLDVMKLESYRTLAASASRPVRDAMISLCEMMGAYTKHPPSQKAGAPHPVGIGTIVPLEDHVIEDIDAHVPWAGQVLEDGTVTPDECKMLGEMFDGISNETNKPLRDAAFHLLWFARELTMDREPLTKDKL